MSNTDEGKLRRGDLISSEKLSFSFEGEEFTAQAGDSIAGALIANNHWLLSRSFKYHRARGALTMAGQDANTLVQIKENPNALADRTTVTKHLEVYAQNYTGSLKKDRNRFLGKISRFLPVGFYYRTFYKPRGVWEYWARYFRKKAGLGVIDTAHRAAYFDKQYLFCDHLVVGAGPAGLLSALAAAEQGQEVLLVDENAQLGGCLNYSRLFSHAKEQRACRKSLTDAVNNHPGITVMTDTTANGWYADNWLPLVSHKRLYKLRATEVTLATGGLEQHAVFRNNDLPGVVMASAAQRLIRQYGITPAQQAVVLAGNDMGYSCALDLHAAGANAITVVDLRESCTDPKWQEQCLSLGIQVLQNACVFEALANSHGDRISAVSVCELDAAGVAARKLKKLECDLLCMSVGYTPAYQLACQAGATLAYEDQAAIFSIDNLPHNLQLAGVVNGKWSLRDCLQEVEHRFKVDFTNSAIGKACSAADEPLAREINHPWPIFPHPKGKEFVDYDEDLQINDILNAVRDGYDNVQLVKRFSTCGMGPSQGRHSALAMARLVAKETGKTVAETGVTTARPPFAAELVAHCAGRMFLPARRSSMHSQHEKAGATFMPAGAWYRPAFYARAEEREQAIKAEVTQVRQGVGLIDVSTLGGLDIRGPDAARFIERMYTMKFAKLAAGRVRYALMLNEAAVVIDDGVVAHLEDQHYYVTATTSGVERVYRNMLKWQTQWQLDVDISNTTAAFCAVNLAGPDSRKVLGKVLDIDLSAAAFPYMAVRQAQLGNCTMRVLRVGFVGELGYEIHLPQHRGAALWDALMSAGEEFGIKPFGVESQRVLRLEKGHIIIGQDTDAMSNPLELNMSWALPAGKDFYFGQRTLQELSKQQLERSLAGFVLAQGAKTKPKENQLIIDAGKMIGRVTSVEYSPSLSQVIGMAYLPPQLAEPGTKIQIRCDQGVMVEATITALPFYDAEGQRQAL